MNYCHTKFELFLRLLPSAVQKSVYIMPAPSYIFFFPFIFENYGNYMRPK